MSFYKEVFFEETYMARENWLSKHGRREGDVLHDEDGEYIYVENETEGVYGPMRKLYLPDEVLEIWND